ncbi:MAG: VOC family protein [Gaiellaceae bacterium]
MTASGQVRFSTTVFYVGDVAAGVAFYERAFGLEPLRLDEHENGAYAELRTGDTKLAFASPELVDRHLPVPGNEHDPSGPPAGVEIGLTVPEVATAYEGALAAGAIPVAPPTAKPWGETVALIRARTASWSLLQDQPRLSYDHGALRRPDVVV